MVRTAWTLTLALAPVFLLILGPARAGADAILVSPPVVSCYYPPPAVAYYSPPAVYAAVPQVSYYYTPAVSYYTPAVSYYAAPAVSYYPAPAAATTTYYGLFGRPRVSTTYYPSAYVAR
jgi:hypothetical protein